MSLKKKVVWLPYDMDTAIGINNEGALTFSYNLEDTDQVDGEDVYNGQQSVFWNNLRKTYYTELKAMYQSLRSKQDTDWDYDEIERRFEEHQSKWPEAIFNEDAWFKYLQPLVDDGDENYLGMLQGSKEEQRKWWLYNRFRYLDSKYNAGDALTDKIVVRGYAKSNITVTPYADIYASIKFGSYLLQQRATRNQTYTFVCPLDNVNDTETEIYSASQLASVGDLSGYQVGYADFHLATKLQNIKLGDASSSYSNPHLYTLSLGNNTLLQTIDCRNCTGLGSEKSVTKAPDLSGCTGLEYAYFEGTQITGVTFANGGILKVVHLPSTVLSLQIFNQPKLTDLSIPSYTQLRSVALVNVGTAVDEISLINSLSNGTNVRFVGFSWQLADVNALSALKAKLDMLGGLDESGNNAMDMAQLQGNIYIPTLTGAAVAEFQASYPSVTFTYDHITAELKYYSWDGQTLLHTETVTDGGDGTYAGTPTRSQTPQYTYSFVGWSLEQDASTADANALKKIESDRNVYAAYSHAIRTYPVYYYNGTVLLQTTENVPYGGSASYTGETPVYNGSEEGEWIFNGFLPTGTNITGATSCYAQYYDNSSMTTMYLKGSLTTYTSTANDTIGQYAFAESTKLTSATAPATTVEQYAFYNCANLTTVDLTSTSATTIAAYAFSGCASLTAVIIRSTSMSTLSNANAFTGTQIASGNGAIYVPSSLVSTYKANGNWGNYNIYSIDEYPVTDFSTITDSWSTIVSKIANGTFSGTVGDTKLLEFGDYSCYMQLVGLEKDNLANGSGKAKTTWLAKGIAITTKRMNASSGTTDGWAGCEMRTWLRETILPTFPSELQSAIKEVTKTYWDYGDSAEETITDTIWIPSLEEVNGITTGSYHAETSGVVYSDMFTSHTNGNHASRVKYNTSGSAFGWWLRSAYSAAHFDYVNVSGSIAGNGATNAGGVVLGFCI